MMGDPGPSDIPELPSVSGNQVRHEFPAQVLPIFGLHPSLPTSSTDLSYPPPLPYFQDFDQHPSVSFSDSRSTSKQDGHEEWTHPASERASGPSSGHRAWAEDRMHGLSSHSDDLFTYPEGEDGAVTITRKDLEGLQPGRFLSDNIIDFYIKYLNLTILSRENQRLFHFFTSFFFTKLLGSTTPMGFDHCKVDYKQLRKWIGEVNLFEKVYVFLPIVDRSHWSLIVICHLNGLDPSSLGEPKGSPCILHLDPMEGSHECYEGQVRSFILQAWMKRMRTFDNVDLLHALVQMKYIQAKVPQQNNNYDCGLYILHYIEVFFSKLTSQDLIPSSLGWGKLFTKPNFKVEVSDKRNCIQSLIFKLGGMSQVHYESHLGLHSKPQQEVGIEHLQGLPKLVKESKSKKWKKPETSLLLESMVGGHFHKGKQGAMHWDHIVEEINTKNKGGPLRSKEQCQNRFDTLLKAYKDLNAYCVKMNKEFCDVTEDEKRSLKLATPLGKANEVWYNHLHTIYIQRSSLRDKSHKRQKVNLDGAIDVSKHASSPLHPSPQSLSKLDLHGSSKPMVPFAREVDEEEFNMLGSALRYTFLNLLQVWSIKSMMHISSFTEGNLSLESLCRMLAIVQDQNPLQIRKYVYELRDLNLVTLRDTDPNPDSDFFHFLWENCWVDKKWLGISNATFYEKLRRKVLSKKPHLKIVHKLSWNDVLGMETYQQIRVLILYFCQELLCLNLGDFPKLRYLDIMDCEKLKEVNGWEDAKQLGWITILECYSYHDFPNVEFLSSLKEFCFAYFGWPWNPRQVANFNQCVQLRNLEIVHVKDLVESMDLKTLRNLEVLRFSSWEALSTIHGLSGLQALMKLMVPRCRSLKRIPDLGCLKALTYLDMSYSGIIEILGLEELHLLTWLDLCHCISLGSLPPLDHLKALAHLDVSLSGIEEIPGVEELVSLETLNCRGSKLKQLPNLKHLSLLHGANICDTPLSRVSSRRYFIGGYELIHNDKEEEGVSVEEISDVSDLSDYEDILLDED